MRLGIPIFARRLALKAAKHSPEILLVAGVVGGVCATVMACKATLRADEVLDEHAEKMEKVKGAIKIAETEEYVDYDVTNAKKDTFIIYTQTFVNFIKLYGPSLAVGAVSLACVLSSWGIMRKRYLGAVAAFKGVSEAFKRYRNAVIKDQGIEADRLYFNGGHRIKVHDEDGREVDAVGVISDPENPGRPEYSQYAKFFDASSREWEDDPEYNLTFLKAQQRAMNDILKTRGHLFLNEVYDALDIPRTGDGALVGWVKGNGDDYVDFGIQDGNSEACRRFVNGYEPYVLLDFNVDGPIYELI